MAAEIELTEGRFHAMGSPCRVVTDLDERAVEFSVHRVEDLEARWSRFRDDSEITNCNLHAGEWVEVSTITLGLVERAVSAFERTRGRFHPLMLRALVELGYDRSHEDLEPEDGELAKFSKRRRRAVEESISIDGSGVRIPPGAAFDPGGIGKGMAADILIGHLLDAGAEWALVSIGGDLRLAGAAIEERGWDVEVENPWRPGATWATAKMHSGALATSSTLSRRWRYGDGGAHHLLDSQTGLPAAGPRVAATAHAAEAWWADVVAKCVVVDPELDAETLEAWGAGAVAFLDGGDYETLGWHANSAFAMAS